jgi:hypothetical protein
MASQHGRMAWGGHELPKVLPGPAIPYPSTPWGRPLLNRPYDHFMGGPPAGCEVNGSLLPHWTPHAICQCFTASYSLRFEFSGQGGVDAHRA